ncbi:MAG: hypothetical protein WBX35_15945, partial [Pseudolabrys sp.]
SLDRVAENRGFCFSKIRLEKDMLQVSYLLAVAKCQPSVWRSGTVSKLILPGACPYRSSLFHIKTLSGSNGA